MPEKHLIDPYMKALLYVLVEEGRQRTVLLKEKASHIAGGSPAIYNPRLDDLIREGLVEIERDGTKKYVILSEKGKKVVEYLKKVDEVMEE